MLSQPVKVGSDTVVVIPSAILTALDIKEGDTLDIALNRDKMEIKKLELKSNSASNTER
ncbi:AbrB/MazE/SpoVT family DNA-binding domain-containing protein [Vibrio sinensis]|uniref:AbrB/MazE/SpoVT family DNA-binding domain-containing protein n=1 Tax=Vibrio sinensis TaxID=2302434 RepID=A0A3A6QI88_9VIBR|nr:AbrB/MazE/SpoVT family DNA-binding domain-containing protein [Vibrio sinensis]RJX66552.1 AbrB/MazE/SpoVT family DNA-binding domain-containing protein [Vibrio sinensis]